MKEFLSKSCRSKVVILPKMSSFTGFSQEFCQNYRIFFSAIKKHQTGNSVILRAVLICCFQSPLCNTLKNTAWRQALIDVVVVVVVFVGHLIVADSLAALYLQTFAPVLLSVVVSSFFYLLLWFFRSQSKFLSSKFSSTLYFLYQKYRSRRLIFMCPFSIWQLIL